MPIIGLALGAVEVISSLFKPVLGAVEDVTDAIEQELGDAEIQKRYNILLEAKRVLAGKLSEERASLKNVTESIDAKIARLRAKYGS